MKKYALYARVSTSSNTSSDGQTTLNQTIRLEEYARSRKWEYELFEEYESTRKTRPIKAALLQRLRAGEFAGIVVVKLDRYARSSTELLLEVQELVDRGVEFHSITENLDFSTPSGVLLFSLVSIFATFERDLIRARTIDGLHRARMQGKHVGRPKGSKDKKKRSTTGYYKTKNTTPEKLIIKQIPLYVK